MSDVKMVELIFDSDEWLFHLVGEISKRLFCELVYSPQAEGELYIFKFKGIKFRVNPNFSGFIGIVEKYGD